MTTTAMQEFKTGLVNFVGLSGGGQGPAVGVTNITYNPGLKEVTGAGAGQITDSFVAILDARPTFNMTVYDIGTMLTNGVGPYELPFGSAFTCTEIDVYACQFQEDGEIVMMSGGFQSGIKFAIAQGLVTLDSISCKQGSPATAKLTIHCESTDGVTHPVTTTIGAALPSIPVLGQMYTLGQVEVNGTTIGSISGMDYSGNFKIKKEASNGALFNSLTTVEKFDPKLTFTSYDAALYNTYGGLGTALTSSTFISYLTALANKSTRQAANTAVHVKIAGSASQGMIWTEDVSLSPSSSEIRLHVCPIVGASPVLAMSLADIT